MNDNLRNTLLDIYSNQFGNRENDFLKYAFENKIEDYNKILEEFRIIQNDLFQHIWTITSPNKQLSQAELEKISHYYCSNKYDWIDEVGITALKRWLVWMSWHEGILTNPI